MTSSRRVIQSNQTVFNPAIKQYWLAGAEFYGSTLAGGSFFDSTTFGSSKLFGLNDNYITKQSMVNKGSSHKALNAPYMSMLNLLNGGEFITMYDFIKKEQTTVVVITAPVVITTGVGTAYGIFSSQIDVNSADIDNLNKEFSSNISALNQEMNMDSELENALESFGYTQFGALGYMTGGVIGGLLDGKNANIGENLAEAVASELKGRVMGAGLKALGIKNLATASAVSLVIGAVIDEALEVAMGLDNHFGFGGDLAGVDAMGIGHYAQKIGFIDGVVGTFQEFVSFGAYHSVFDEKNQEALAELALANFDMLTNAQGGYGIGNYGSLGNMTTMTATEQEQRGQNYNIEFDGGNGFDDSKDGW